MTRNIKLTIEYDGTLFNGWQRQASSKTQRTIQGEIEKVFKKIFKQHVKLIGSGRTDSGVHALGQVASFKTHTTMPLVEIQNALNANLPEDIAIIKTEEVPLDFHAQYSVKSKTYSYTILNRNARCTQQRNFCLLYPYTLNIRAMRDEAKSFVGRKDFKSFTASDPAKRKNQKAENTIRTIKNLTITKKGDFITITVEANGFLYKMVRNIVGTLLEAGNGKLKKGSVKQILSKKDRNAAGHTAKPKGLTLLKVQYSILAK